jgi:uncharacterized membrane protein
MPEQDEQHAERDTALERTIFLSDGVFAIAMTLLVLTIGIPGGNQATELPRALIVISLVWPSTTMYALSFIVVGIYWMAHQRIFHYITRSDGGLLWLNVFFLLTIAFLPVPTNVLGHFGDSTAAAIFYALSLTATGLVLLALWRYASAHHRLVDAKFDAAVITHQTRRLLIAPGIAVLSIGLAFVSPYLAEASWLLIGVAIYLYERGFRRHAA